MREGPSDLLGGAYETVGKLTGGRGELGGKLDCEVETVPLVCLFRYSHQCLGHASRWKTGKSRKWRPDTTPRCDRVGQGMIRP